MPGTRKHAPARRSSTRTATRARKTSARGKGTGARGRGRARSARDHGLLGLSSLWPQGLPRLGVLDQRGREVVGLALVALGVFMGFVLYGGWDGGHVGHGLAVALGWTLGKARALAPLALIGAGAMLLLRQSLSFERSLPRDPRTIGGACLFAGVTLALAAGTLGVSSGPGLAQTAWHSPQLQSRGGAFGEALYQLTHRLVQDVGVGILVVFLLLVGVILITGASLGGTLRATGSGVLETTRMMRSLAAREDEPGRDDAPVDDFDLDAYVAALPGMQPPEPGAGELVVRATHVEGPAQETAELDAVDDPFAEEAPAREDGPGASDAARRQGALEAAAGAESQPAPGEEGEEEDITGVARAEPGELTPQGRLRDVVTEDPNFVWELPDASKLLTRSSGEQTRPDTAGQAQTASALVEALGHFGVQAKVIGTVAGPHITRYELRLAPGTKVAKVAQLKDDLAYALAATDIRILAPIPGKQAVGVEVPNVHRRMVRLGDVFQQPPKDWSPLTVWLGKDVAGKAIGADLAKMPHLLVAGTTGAGKSGAINAMLSSVLLRASPHEVRLVLVDPKQVELNHYESIPHLLTPVITSPRMAANALQNLVKEMESRYGIMSMARTRSLIELNKARAKRGEAPLPYILCVIDELADLMMVAPADVEDSIIRLAQKARAVGIHLVLATQSPRVDVITGMIKANVPSRIAFAVSSQTDSRVILDQNGAESLLGQGDMLFSPVGTSRLQRIQGAYIDERQIERLTSLWRKQGEPELREELLEEVEKEGGAGSDSPDEFDPDEDPLLGDAIRLVAEMQTASTSMLQRRLRLGYTRAGRVIDMLERRGVISGYEGSKPRQVLVSEADLPRVLAALAGGEPATAESAAAPSD
ncbi:MAG TPA: DNA translocase FtsK 4TM domain-containing protein [Solirubrobacteraceae bacterium]|jgi:S-DNA-T family DNA segregation ATPase FtsK/SpoIIIE|nr:DNA translocase FtsK 4TM domain-containing protein [Solirubrobacteraceae bacterium]